MNLKESLALLTALGIAALIYTAVLFTTNKILLNR
jgi:hypothetical protein